MSQTPSPVLYLEKRKLGATAAKIFDSAEDGNTIVHVPAMVLAEILYLSEKSRISTSLKDVFQLLEDFPSFRDFAISGSVLASAAEIVDIPELHDRLISAAARLLNLNLITNDPKMEASAFVKTIW